MTKPIDLFFEHYIIRRTGALTRILRNRHDAEDAAQMIAAKMWRRLTAFIYPFPTNRPSQEIAPESGYESLIANGSRIGESLGW